MSISRLPPSTSMTVEQALQSALSDADEITEVLVVGWRDGNLYVRSSRLSRMEALWLLEKAKADTLQPEGA